MASKFFELKGETAFNLTKIFDPIGKKCLSSAIKNVVQFSRRIENSALNLSFNFFFNDNFLGFWMVNNFETSHMYSTSIK